MRYRLRTLLIALAIVPAVIAAAYWFYQTSRAKPPLIPPGQPSPQLHYTEGGIE